MPKAKRKTASLVLIALCWSASAWAQGAMGPTVFVQRNSANRNAVAAFAQDAATGVLSLVGVFRTGGKGEPAINGNQSHALAAWGSLLFVTNAGDNSISTFRIQRDGGLVLLSQTPSRGVRPVSLAVKKNILLVVNQGIKEGSPGAIGGNVRAFRIGADGRLSRIADAVYRFSPKDLPNEILSNSANPLFTVGRSGSNSASTFWLHNEGTISLAETVFNIPDPLGGAIKPGTQSTVILTLPDRDTAGVTSLQMNARGRTLVRRTYPRPEQKDPCWAAIHPDGVRVWTSAFATRLLSLYLLGSDGSLKAVSNYSYSRGPGSVDIAVDSAGSHLFRLEAFRASDGGRDIRPAVDVFSITGQSENAGLALVGSYLLPEDWRSGAPTGIVAVSPNPI